MCLPQPQEPPALLVHHEVGEEHWLRKPTPANDHFTGIEARMYTSRTVTAAKAARWTIQGHGCEPGGQRWLTGNEADPGERRQLMDNEPVTRKNQKAAEQWKSKE